MGSYLFQGFRFDAGSDELFQVDPAGNAVPIPLGARATALLALLLDRSGRLVRKNEIMEVVWDGRAVEDANLTVQVAALRRLLDSQQSEPSAIQTVPGRGYRFIAQVTRAGSSEDSEAASGAAAIAAGRSAGTDRRDGSQPLRRLSAILAADVTGLGRLTGVDHLNALARLEVMRREVIAPAIAARRGRIVQTTGDGLLAEFSSAVEAMKTAIEIQAGTAKRKYANAGLECIQYRVAVDVGDVVVDGNDLLGDAVNIAARLLELVEPGGIITTGTTMEHLRSNLDVNFDDWGEHRVKNVDRAIRAWHWQGEGQPQIKAGTVVNPKFRPINPSIAVLPFESLSSDPNQEFLADGITDDIITSLSKFRWFLVIARNSTFTYKGKREAISQIARELGVRYVLKGTLRRNNDQLRVTVQLIDADTNSHVWAQTYNLKLIDIFEVQDEIAQVICGALEPELAGAERARAKRKPPGRLDAWEAYQRGLWHLWQMTKDDIDEAQRLVHLARATDADFALPYAALAYMAYVRVIQGWTQDSEATLEQGVSYAHHAIRLEPNDPLPHMALGRVLAHQGKFEAAFSALGSALELNPNYAIAHNGMGTALSWSDAPARALPHLRTAMRLSPTEPTFWIIETHTGYAHAQLGEFDTALALIRHSANRRVGGFWPWALLAWVQHEVGDYAAAAAALGEARTLRPDFSLQVASQATKALHQKYRTPLLAALAKHGLN